MTHPWSRTPTVQSQGLTYLDYGQLPLLVRDETDQQITVGNQFHQRPYLLSNDLYQTPSWWWIFAIMNPNQIQDPIWDLRRGMTITVPASTRLKALFDVRD